MNGNLAGNLTRAAERHGQVTALRLDETGLDYQALEDAAARMADLMQASGLQPGDRVGIMLPNVLEFAVIYYGALRAGLVIVPMNVLFKRGELRYNLEDSGASVLYAWGAFAEEAQPAAAAAGARCLLVGPGQLDLAAVQAHGGKLAAALERADGDTAVILYTSGTTGRPKGAELTHANLRSNAEACVRLFGLDQRSVVLGVLPLFHSFGQTCGLNAAIAAGSTLTLVVRFEPGKALAIVERDRVTLFEGVPTMYGALLNHPDRQRFDLSSLRLCVSGGASLPVEVLRRFEAAFDCTIIEGYGLSETSPVASFNHTHRPRKAGSIGTPIEGVEMMVVGEDRRPLPAGSVGEIVIRGPNIMKGYWRRPEATAEAIDAAGWFHSGDLARVDEDGYFFIVDRKKDLIIRGGFNVYPREVEEILYQHPAVREAAVVGIPHQELGEEVGAAVVRKPGSEVTAQELRDFVKGQLAAFKYPRHIWFVDELPRTATGKILKREIARPAAGGSKESAIP
jgi:long-chain acyl-CoA synthetase